MDRCLKRAAHTCHQDTPPRMGKEADLDYSLRMRGQMTRILILASLLLPLTACRAPQTAGVVQNEERLYVPSSDPLVAEKLRAWQGLKLGLLMHWGPYSQWGVVESWSICGEDVPWTRRNSDDYVEYKRQYENLKTTFNPRDFEPEEWARAARDAGMRYVVFTTKHHDGFCMFDTKLTDYKITDPRCPFHDDPRADVTRAIFDAFRAEGMWTGAYFSKPDWHSEDYWWPYFPTPDRNVNYEINRYPERWDRFVQYTHGQIEELVTRYGPLDILWLDGGWVRPLTDEQIANRRANPAFRFNRPQSQDIRMDELAAMARRHQPGLLVVDRAVPGVHQNYLTPENRVPDEPLPFPWESCIISGGGWSHSPNATYMSAREGVHLLIDIVAKGGNLLLNIAPGPDGRWQDGAYDLLEGIGDWMHVNGKAIYGSTARAPYKQDNVCVINGADGAVYAIVLADGNDDRPPAEILVPSVKPAPDAVIRMLGDELALTWEQSRNDVVVTIPDSLRENPPCDHAWVFRIPVAE